VYIGQPVFIAVKDLYTRHRMILKIDETQYPVYTLDEDPEMEKKKSGTYSIEEILEAVKALHEQNKSS